MKFIMLINVKMPTIVGILTFISRINSTSERLSSNKLFCQYFSFYEQLKFRAQLSWAWIKVYNLGARHHPNDLTMLITIATIAYAWRTDIIFCIFPICFAQFSHILAQYRLFTTQYLVQCNPIITLCLGSIGMDHVIIIGRCCAKTYLRGFWQSKFQTSLLGYRD